MRKHPPLYFIYFFILGALFAVNPVEPAHASQRTYDAAEGFAHSLHDQLDAAATQGDFSAVPQFKGEGPPETQFQGQVLEGAETETKDLHQSQLIREKFQDDRMRDPMLAKPNKALGEAAHTASSQEDAALAVRESYDARGKFKLDIKNDPLFVKSDKVQEDSLKIVAGEDSQMNEIPGSGGVDETKTCEEAGDPGLYSCFRTLRVAVNVSPEVKEGSRCCNNPSPWYLTSGRESWASGITPCKSCGNYYKNSEKIISPEKVVVTEVWDSNCGALEDRVDQGQCFYMDKKCVEGPQTRSIQNKPVTRPCWKESCTYACEHPAKNDCGALRGRGCEQVGSTCSKMVGGACVLYQQTYKCRSGVRSVSRLSVQGKETPFCLDGNCSSHGYTVNDEMLDAIAKLSVFKEIQDNIKGGIGQVFKGGDHRCSRNCFGFKDCCKSLKGWGISIGMAACSSDEKHLAEQKDKKLCRHVGTYCDKRDVAGICTSKKTSYCCFPSKLSRIVHEQGRAQLGIGWGQAKQPECRGLSVEELSRIDFSRLDLSELYQDVMAKYRAPHLNKLKESVTERFEQLQTSLEGAKTPQALPDHLRKTRKEGL